MKPSTQVVTPAKPKATAKQSQELQQYDRIMKIINSGTAHSKTLTSKEKKEHVELWEYITQNYGHTPSYAIYRQLAQELGVKLKNPAKATSAEKKQISKKLKEWEKKI
ncbi:MAG: hypothetical protein IJ709_01440 [Selenomonas sp.]|nr:hypothetical protein [Selenomonas sp.]